MKRANINKGIVARCLGAFYILLCGSACTDPAASTQSEWQGSGVALYADYEPFATKPLRIFYFVPNTAGPDAPVLFVFHGSERNALEYRNALIDKSKKDGFILVVPEFTELDFPGVNAYQLGNVYQNGDSPSVATRNLEPYWSLSLVEPIFSFVKLKTRNTSATYSALGHSGGAQFLHRFLLFKPTSKINKAVISAAGWYTVPDTAIAFPYGLKESPYQPLFSQNLWAKTLFVQVGSADVNSNSTSVRHTPEADLQGANRLERAQYFYNSARNTASQQGWVFAWQLKIAPGLSHDYVDALNYGAALLFP
jgi:hypothetical protein